MTGLRPWQRNSLVAATLLATFLIGTPFLLQKLFTDWLLEHGGEQVTIKDIDFNPLTGILKLEGLQATGTDRAVLSVNEAQLDIAWLPLLKRQVTVQAIHLSGFSGNIDMRTDALSIGGIVIPQDTPTDQPETPPEPGKAWSTGIRQLSFDNINLTYLDPQLKLHVVLDELKLDVLEQWSPDTPASIRARGRIEDAPFSLNGMISPFAVTPSYQADYSVKQLPLTPFSVFAAPTVTQLAGRLSLEGKLELALGKDGPQFEQSGSLMLEALQLGLDTQQPDKAPTLQLAKLEASELLVTPTLVSIKQLHHSDLTLQLHINEQGELNIVKQTAEQEDPAPGGDTAEKASTEQEPSIEIAINEIVIDGDSTIHFSDDSVTPRFEQDIGLHKVTLQQLDTRQPEQQSPFSIDASLGQHGSLKVDGQVQPFLESPGIKLESSARAIGLPPLSSYTRGALGLKLDSGTLDMDLDLEDQAGKLDGKTTLKLHQLTLETVESENSLQDRLPIPINLALSTLRDSNNTIELDIPFSGDADSPEFDVSDAIGKAVADGLSKGAMTYLTVALQPYGAILTAAKFASDQLGQVQLQAVTFTATDATLQAEQRPYLDKVAGLLKQRPGLTVRVCGIGVQQDLPPPATPPATDAQETGAVVVPAEQAVANAQKALESLAQTRADNVMAYLVEQAGVSASQLVHCAPRLELDNPDSEPRTELLL